jgi:hypothetical protein
VQRSDAHLIFEWLRVKSNFEKANLVQYKYDVHVQEKRRAVDSHFQPLKARAAATVSHHSFPCRAKLRPNTNETTQRQAQ